MLYLKKVFVRFISKLVLIFQIIWEKNSTDFKNRLNTIETLGRKYDSFNADSEFKDRFKEVFYNFVKLINNFTYALQIKKFQG